MLDNILKGYVNHCYRSRAFDPKIGDEKKHIFANNFNSKTKLFSRC